MRQQVYSSTLIFVALSLAGVGVQAQTPAPSSPQTPQAGRGGGGRSAYPQRAPAEPASLERGKGLYSVNCGFCHGSDARGGEGGPNLLRSQSVLNDNRGELIAPIVKNGRPGGMPALSLSTDQITDIAAFLHSMPVGGRDIARSTPESIVVGDANAGKAFFAQKCSSCHSVDRDLKGIGTRIPDAKNLQHAWLMPGGGGRGGRGPAPTFNIPPTTVTVTFAGGQKVEGRLERVDDFLVTLRDAEGNLRSFPRKGSVPRVDIHDPLQPHLDLLPVYTDKNIHDLTAYLVTLK